VSASIHRRTSARRAALLPSCLIPSKEDFARCVRGVTDARARSAYHSSHDDGLEQNKQPDRWTMTKTLMITKMAAAIVLASVAAGVASSSAQAGWGENGQYGNAPQARPQFGPHFNGYGGNGGQRPVVVVPGPRPMPQVNVYPRPAPPVYIPPQVVVRPVQYPVVVNRPVYIPTPQVVEKTVVVQRPATVVAAPAVAAAPAPVVNNNCNCLVKEYPQAGVVVFRDICTKESATYTNLPQQTSQAVLPPTQ